MVESEFRWETVPCPLCGCSRDREFQTGTSEDGSAFRLGECTRCSMVYTNPRPDAASISHFYPSDYAPYQPPRRQRAGLLRQLRARLGLRREKTLADRVPVNRGSLFLDVGCGSGWYAAQMRERGWDARGVDFSPHAVAAARRNFGLDVVQGSLPHSRIQAESVHFLTLRAVLEHLHEPRPLLRAAYDALQPGGWFYASVPNLASWGFRTFRTEWFPLDPPRHLLHFTPITLRRMVEEAGFVVEDVATLGHTKWMGLSVNRAREVHPRWWHSLVQLRVLRSGLTRWTNWLGQGDDLAVLARKPHMAATRQAA